LADNAGAAALLTRTLLLVATCACAVYNGFGFPPVHESVDYMLGVALRGYPLMTRALIYNYVTPLAIALMTLAIAGIPAALYERIRGLRSSTAVSLGIWLVATVLLALPTIIRAVAGDELN
jgi:hypothetical protein